MKDEKKYISLVVVIITFLIILFILLKPTEKFPETISINLAENENNKITVTGKAERFVKPDLAQVSFSLTRKSKDLKVATNSVNERMNKLIDALKDKGIDKKDIKTISYNVYPEYEWIGKEFRKKEFSGYRVNQQIQIKIREIEEAGEILSLIGNYQVDNVSSLRFLVDNEDEIKKELESEAIAEARGRAKKLAKDLGISLDKIISYQNTPSYRPFYATKTMLQADGLAESQSANIPTGENKISVEVRISYRISSK